MKRNSSSQSAYFEILAKINTMEAKVGVIGVGYVGKALTESLVSSGFKTFGYDTNREKLLEIDHEFFRSTNSVLELEECDVVCICVPTPVDEFGKPDLSFLINASRDVSKLNSRKKLTIVESTVAPGTLKNLVLPIFVENGKTLGTDFLLATSPERVDPGNKVFNIKNTPKVVGGVDKESTLLASLFYSKFVERVVPTTSAEVAELSKMFENTFRLVNISLVNEIKEYAENIGVNMWEVIDAAATKPFAFLPHYPGPGVGGHCIPVDPVYLLEDAKKRNLELKILESSIMQNNSQPKKVLQKAKEVLNGHSKGVSPKIMVIGISYKPNIKDTRESAGVKILEEAEKEGFEVSYHDPHVPKLNGYTSKAFTSEEINQHDVIVIATDHKDIPYEILTKINKPIIDTRNVMSKYYSSEVLRVEEEYS